MSELAIVDCETTGLDPRQHTVWEVAVIRRTPDGDREALWQIRPTSLELATADPEALEICRYEERLRVPDGWEAADLTTGSPQPMSRLDVARAIHRALTGTVFLGSNPVFDVAFLRGLLRVGREPWHYRPIDVPSLVAGYLHARGEPLELPFRVREMSRAVGVEPPGSEVAHTALGDARWIRDVYDGLMRMRGGC